MSHSRQTAQASMQLGARRLTLLRGLDLHHPGWGGVEHTTEKTIYMVQEQKINTSVLWKTWMYGIIYSLWVLGLKTFFLKSCLCSQFAQSVCLTDMGNTLLNLWHHDLALYDNGLFTHPCSYPTVALLDAFFVFLNLPSLSFTPDFFDDDKALSKY